MLVPEQRRAPAPCTGKAPQGRARDHFRQCFRTRAAPQRMSVRCAFSVKVRNGGRRDTGFRKGTPAKPSIANADDLIR